MEFIQSLLQGFSALATGPIALALLMGAFLGIVVGVLPGVGPGVTIAVLLPFTYGMVPLAGISLLLGVYCGAFYGGAVTSILIRTPGEASSIMTMFDGYPMAQKGQAERALSLAFMSAFIGGVVSALLLGLAARPMAGFAARFGAPENVMAIVLAAVCVGKAYRKQFSAALMMMGLGFFLATLGIDPNSNEQRYTFGSGAMLSGIPLVPVAVGLFGLAQALVMISSPKPQFDASLITWIATSNRKRLLPESLRSRFREFEIVKPSGILYLSWDPPVNGAAPIRIPSFPVRSPGLGFLRRMLSVITTSRQTRQPGMAQAPTTQRLSVGSSNPLVRARLLVTYACSAGLTAAISAPLFAKLSGRPRSIVRGARQ